MTLITGLSVGYKIYSMEIYNIDKDRILTFLVPHQLKTKRLKTYWQNYACQHYYIVCFLVDYLHVVHKCRIFKAKIIVYVHVYNGVLKLTKRRYYNSL